MTTLSLEFWTEDNDFYIYAEVGDYEKELTLEGQAKAIIAQFKTVYGILEEKKTGKAKELADTLQALSKQLLTPFADELKKCSVVRFIVYEDLVRCAFDLLPFDGAYLFLQRSVCYQVDEGEGEDEPEIKLESALIIADLTADPEEACLAVSKLIPDSQYVEVKDASLRMIKDAGPEVDALVISAHGELENDNSGTLYINDNDGISAKIIAAQEAWIVYFDSCQQGANMTYLQTFQDDSDAQYYLAPIISNDAGDSSTLTMTWFFKAVMEHGNPIQALSETRQRLFKHYQGKKLDIVTTLNKAFCFRLYEFVDSAEEE
jgi:hypothetical protein